MEKEAPEKSASFVCREEQPNISDTTDTPPPEPTAKADDKTDDKNGDEEKEEDDEKEKKEVEDKTEENKENNNEDEDQTLPDEADEDPLTALQKLSEDIDRFVVSSQEPNAKTNGQIDDNENDDHVSPEVPEFVDKFLELIEEMVEKHDSGEGKVKWNKLSEEGSSSFLEAVDRISKLNNKLLEMKLEGETHGLLINRVGSIHHRAMVYLEEEFRWLLMEESKTDIHDSDPGGDNNNNQKGKPEQHDSCPMPGSESAKDEAADFPGYTNDVVSKLHKIAKEMILGGYEWECLEVYMNARRIAFEDSLQRIGCEKHSIDDVHKIQWDALERDIGSWITALKQCSTVLFSCERKLAEAVFSDYPSISTDIFSCLIRGIVIEFLNFCEGVSMSKCSAEKLFKTLDMYETLRDMVPKMDALFPEDCASELKKDATLTRSRLGEAAISLFCDLENSIKSDTGKTPVAGGAVHPLSRYTMNYLKYACEYKDTLEQVFREHSKIERADSTSRPHGHDYEVEATSMNQNNDSDKQSPFSVQLMRVMDLLDANLEVKSKLYKDVALSSIFMMNNGRYIVQKIKGSTEIHEVMGDTWCRRRSSELRQYHKNYQRETWSKLLGCLSHEGLNVHGKVPKPVLKERFKSFNAMFEEIHKTQSTWVVSDEQLQSELRVSISAVVIPAYRSFLGRFSQVLDPGRQTEKYIKFQPDDLETYIDELFDGNPMSMARRRQ
ncbi:hypothetical protein FNV43_RR22370 [Rhamnella rubrinervis]|uniref:Exocyst subunit Exo70 family protein n=1 Tax=Rhamnella rubrinervis TaxID=2594499 RepID=A0A8K0GSF9_9ROSA|nr:hypothetical protein FNV43_RR22370 [Rhamnella rubrinervis]